MRRKLFTPLNLGAFDLRHRLVVDWGQAVAKRLDASDRDHKRMHVSELSGGLVVHDPGSLVWGEATQVSLDVIERTKLTWRRVIETAKSSRQWVLARLTADLTLGFPEKPPGIRSLADSDTERIISDFARAANLAKLAGFDGIELDCAAGSVTDVFLRASIDDRSDRYGGPLARRVNFMMDLLEGLIHAFGRERIGVRLSPFRRNGAEGIPTNVYDEVLRSLHDQEIAYVHLVNAKPSARGVATILRLSPAAKALRRAYPGILVSSGQQSLSLAMDLVESRWADAVCFSGATLDAQFLSQVRRARSQGNGA